MHLNKCRCFQTHLRMLLQSLTALCLAPGGPGSIWNNLGVLVRLTGVSGRFACGFRTDLHFADVSVTHSRLFSVRLLLLVYNSGYCGLRTDITPVTCYPESKSARHVPITCRRDEIRQRRGLPSYIVIDHTDDT
jgi:hypothetical protein